MNVLGVVALALIGASVRGGLLTPTSVPVTVVPFSMEAIANDTILVVDVAVGTPAHRMNLTLDESLDAAFLFDSASATPKCFDVQPRHYFDEKASTTFNQTNQIYGDDGTWSLGWIYTGDCKTDRFGPSYAAVDNWQIGTIASQRLPLIYGRNMSSSLVPQWKSDGVLGLALWFHQPLTPNDGSAIEALISHYPEQVVSLYLQRQPTLLPAPTPGGFLTIGGKDTQHCSDWTYLPFDPDALGWGAQFDSAQLGSVTFKTALGVYFVLTTEYISTADFPTIVEILDAEYDFKSDGYIVSCDAVSGLPDLVFKLAGTEFNLPASDYTRKTADAANNRCILLIENSIDPDSWILGTTFLRPYCLALDFQKVQVALGKAA